MQLTIFTDQKTDKLEQKVNEFLATLKEQKRKIADKQFSSHFCDKHNHHQFTITIWHIHDFLADEPAELPPLHPPK